MMNEVSASLPDEVVRFFGDRMLLCYMATARPDRDLAIVPMGVVLHEGLIRISTHADSLKVRNLRRDPHIAVCVPQPEDARRYLSIRGTADVAEDTDRQFIRWIARERMGTEEHPHDPEGTERVAITVRARRFLFSGAQGTGPTLRLP